MVEAAARDSTTTLHQTPELAARAARIAIYKTRLNVIRDLVRKRFEQGATGAQTSGYQSELFDEFVVWVLTEALSKLEPSLRALLESQSGLLREKAKKWTLLEWMPAEEGPTTKSIFKT